MLHAINFLSQRHAQVNHHGTTADRLVDFVLGHVADKDHTTFEVEGFRQIFVLDVSIPGDDTLAIGIKSRLQDVQSNWILEDSVAVIKHDSALVVFKQSAIETLGGGVTLDKGKALAGIQDRANLKLSQIRDVLQTIGFQRLGDRVGLTQTAFARNHCGGLDASGDHGHEFLNEREPLIDTVLFVLRVHGFGRFSHSAGHLGQLGFHSRFVLATNHDLAIERAHEFARGRVKRDQRFHSIFLHFFIHHISIILQTRIKVKGFL